MREGSLSGQAAPGRRAARPGATASATCGCWAPSCRCSCSSGWGLVNLTGLGVFWWIGPMVRLRDDPAARHRHRRRRQQRARGGRGLARAGPLLPLGHLPVPAVPVRRVLHRLLADDPPRRAAGHRPDRHRGHARHAQRHRHQHRARARAQEGTPRAVVRAHRAGAVRLRPLLHRAQPRATTSGSPRRTTRPPAGSARSFCGFWPRTVAGSVRNGWRLERTRLRRMGKRCWTPAQRRAQRLGDDRGAVGRADRRCSASGILPYLLLQAVLAFSLLEAVNYLEHYGLRRADAAQRPLRAGHARGTAGTTTT